MPLSGFGLLGFPPHLTLHVGSNRRGGSREPRGWPGALLSLSGRRCCHSQGATDRAGGRPGWVLDGASVLEDGLIGLVHMLGDLWRSTLQGKLYGERGAGGHKALIPRAPL